MKHKQEHRMRRDPVKRAFDVGVSFMLLTLSTPLMVIIALLIKLDSDGPIFYSQTRVGRDRRGKGHGRHHTMAERRLASFGGKPFQILKFRSMRTTAEADGKAVWCRPGDPRVTRIGALLRKTHLDELPQLINIFKSEMSLVGPRPERPEMIETLSRHIPSYHKRHALKPGLTGLAQIRHRADLEMKDVKKKVRYDILYGKNPSIFTDAKIILGTVPLAMGMAVNKMRVRRTIMRKLLPAKVAGLCMSLLMRPGEAGAAKSTGVHHPPSKNADAVHHPRPHR